MGLNTELIRKLLIVACIFGILQGLLTFVGGIIACFDRNKDVIFKSYCSSIRKIARVPTRVKGQQRPGSSSRKVQIAIQKIVTIARLIRQIEVGLRESISIVSLKRITITITIMIRILVVIALQERIPINLLCLLLLYVVFFGLQQEGFLSWLLWRWKRCGF